MSGTEGVREEIRELFESHPYGIRESRKDQLAEALAALVERARRDELHKVHTFIAAERLRRDNVEQDIRKGYGGRQSQISVYLESVNEEFRIISDFISGEIDRLSGGKE
jgi:hypothetical protein